MTREERVLYNRNYYKSNRTRLLRYRAKRYRDDPEYRAAINAKSKLSMALKRVSSRVVDNQTVTHNGVVEHAYSLLGMSEIVNRPLSTLYMWKTRGVIPISLYVSTSRGESHYSASQVQFVKRLVDWYDGQKDIRMVGSQAAEFFHEVWHKTFSPEEFEKSLRGVLNSRRRDEKVSAGRKGDVPSRRDGKRGKLRVVKGGRGS